MVHPFNILFVGVQYLTPRLSAVPREKERFVLSVNSPRNTQIYCPPELAFLTSQRAKKTERQVQIMQAKANAASDRMNAFRLTLSIYCLTIAAKA